jgi:hypothetical protein
VLATPWSGPKEEEEGIARDGAPGQRDLWLPLARVLVFHSPIRGLDGTTVAASRLVALATPCTRPKEEEEGKSSA